MRKTLGGQFDVDDLERVLTPAARDAMLDLILRWASLDGAVSQLYAAVFNLDDEERADEISSEKMSVKLRKVELTLRPALPAIATAIGKLKKQADKFGKVRDTIAHFHCSGMLRSKPDYLVFLRYRKHAGGGLIVDAVPVEQITDATRFAEHLRSVVEKMDRIIRESAHSDWPPV